jgi:hypothetical protein
MKKLTILCSSSEQCIGTHTRWCVKVFFCICIQVPWNMKSFRCFHIIQGTVWLAATSPCGCLPHLVLLLSFWAMLALHAKLSWRKDIWASGGALFLGPGRRDGSVCDAAGHVLRGVPRSSIHPSLRASGRIWLAAKFSISTSRSSTSWIHGRLPGMQNRLNRYRR